MLTRPTIIFFLILASLIIYWPAINYDFSVWDDNWVIIENQYLRSPSISNTLHYWLEPQWLYMPMTYTLWSLLSWLSTYMPAEPYGINPHILHTANITLHILNTLVLFGILTILLKFRSQDEPDSEKVRQHIEVSAAFGALVFALHPVQVESVVWITAMASPLSTFFSFLAIRAYLVFAIASKTESYSVNKPLLYIAASSFFLLALLTKPAAVVVPIVIFIIDRWFIKRSFSQIAVSLVGWFLLSGLFAVIATTLQQSDISIVATPLWGRPFVAGDSLAFYLYKLVLPLKLGIDYGRMPDYVLHQWWGYATWLFPVSLFAALLLLRKKELWLISLGVFVASVLPVLGFTAFIFQNQSTVNDRYLYFPMLGAALFVSWLLFNNPRRRVLIISTLFILLLGTRSFIQVQVWEDDFSLFTNALKVNPVSFTARNNMGNLLRTKGKPGEAIKHFELALKIRPGQPDVHYNFGVALKQTGELDKSIYHLKEAIKSRSNLASAHNNLGTIFDMQGQSEKAAGHYMKALDARPDYPGASFNLGVNLAKRGMLNEAIDHYKKVLILEPQNEMTHANIGVAYAKKGEFDKAIIHFTEAIKIKPDFDSAKKYLEMAREKQNR